MSERRRIILEVELGPDPEPIQGVLECEGREASFTGYVGLISALEEMRRSARGGDAPKGKAAEAGSGP